MGIQNLEHSVNISFNKPDPPAKKAVSQVPSERSIRLKELLANNWVNDQLNIQKISATDLLKKIKKIVPTYLSLQLVLNH